DFRRRWGHGFQVLGGRGPVLGSPGRQTRAGAVFPLGPGQPRTAHWGIPDPAEAKGSPAEIALAFKDASRMLHQRIGVFTALPIRSLDRLSLQRRLEEIGRMQGATRKVTEPS